MKIRLIGILLWFFFPLCMMAQGDEFQIIKGDCLPSASAEGVSHRASRRLPAYQNDWDPSKTYHQLVILFSFADADFTRDDPKEYYERLFNEPGYNEGHGPGCMSDYFRTQSNGFLNLQCDVYGPYKVPIKACPIENPDEKTRNYGSQAMMEATNRFLEDHPEIDFSPYDWNGDGKIEQVVFVYAGTPGNVRSSLGHIWPNTSSFSALTTPDGKKISNYSASAEYWGIKQDLTVVYCGIGTICHEYSHCLGLPDIYPVGSPSLNLPYASVDEWDLMDGGNFVEWGWCPPSYSPLEKMLLGWQTPIELTEATTIIDLKPVSEGGAAYQIKHTDNEYLLLENRQWTGWDTGIPGKGLVIYHVNYNESAWRNNTVNSFNSEDDFRYKLFHADNKTFATWEAELGTKSNYVNPDRMNKLHLSTSSYPYGDNKELTNTSTPAALMKTKNPAGENLLSKPITNIQMTNEGLVSFDFMGGTTGIEELKKGRKEERKMEGAWYDLSGQRPVSNSPQKKGVYIFREKDGTTYKVMINAK
ncbi:M6 family metalloprotease domain-containing protein [Prevotella sp. tf2-5]|uniref:M6 family metalloprotease domain-containing protein n=1 Tax=Prevotella sp. tf2-5 TaxID=1761889 RepID=UPI0008E6783B|nr:M6 family metalloprotease domain-containing protein [Prevotella sp. tf2-5]SFO78911.1 M6 family metalloprotease domain-containing protein [Prevotella sp. tf2-5]